MVLTGGIASSLDAFSRYRIGFVLAIVLLPFSASIDTHLCIVLLTHF